MPNARFIQRWASMCLPIVLSRRAISSICTNAIVVEISRSPEFCSRRSNDDSGGALHDADIWRP